MIGWILLGIAAVVVLYTIVVFNSLIRLRNQVANAFAQIDVQLKRRYDLIPNLVEATRKFLQHEQDTLTAVIAARNQAQAAAGAARVNPAAAAPMAALGAAEGLLGGVLGRLMAVVEAYPELKGDKTIRELKEELASTENRIGFARQAYNDTVETFNNRASQFPANIVAALFGFPPSAMLESTETPEERKAPKVQF